MTSEVIDKVRKDIKEYNLYLDEQSGRNQVCPEISIFRQRAKTFEEMFGYSVLLDKGIAVRKNKYDVMEIDGTVH